jgi:hypothetical protein
MTTQKRRVIYMDDEVWAKAQEEAARYGSTVSAHFRSLIVGGRVIPISVRDEIEPLGTRFNSRGSRPVPKK